MKWTTGNTSWLLTFVITVLITLGPSLAMLQPIPSSDNPADNPTDYYKKLGDRYQSKINDDYPIYYRKVKVNGSAIPQIMARLYVPLPMEEFVRALRDCGNYHQFLPGQSRKFPTQCGELKEGKFEQTAVMDLPWPCKDLKYKSLVTPFNLTTNASSNTDVRRYVETWANLPTQKDPSFGETLENKGSWTMTSLSNSPTSKGFFLQYEFLVVPSTHVPEKVKGWLADAALEKIIVGMVNRAYDPHWTNKQPPTIRYKKIKVTNFDELTD